MVTIAVRHKVEDFEKWKAAYDEHESIRTKAGCQSDQIFHNGENPNDVLLVFEWDSIENAKKFSKSENLKEAMQKAGVASKPDFYYS